jgi:predicted PurR-regulated permease PerM
MAKSDGTRDWQKSVVMLAGMLMIVVAVGALYWAQSVFIPIAMAAFLTFLLNPLVAWLRRCGVGRTPSVLIAVLVASLLLTIVAWAATTQISSLVKELPNYTYTIRDKIRSLKHAVSGSSRFAKMVTDIYDEIELPSGVARDRSRDENGEARVWEDRPKTVVVGPETPFWLSRIAIFLNPLMESMAQLALAFILVIFMLYRREELRNRIICLLGQGRVVAATRFVDEAGQRISRFLAMQAVVNGAFGLTIGVGLSLIGVRHALLWGFLAAIFRYLPFIGPMLAAVFPAAISFAMSSTLAPMLLVLGLFLTVELVVANLIEPRLYGKSMGVSEIALLVSAAFWAFLWGPIGLVLSSPLTVCLVSLGRYAPQFEFLWLLLGDGPALDPEISLYQRLLARDEREAEELVFEMTKPDCVDQVYDTMLVPALRSAKLSHAQGVIDNADLAFMFGAIRKIVEDLPARRSEIQSQAQANDSEQRRTEQGKRPAVTIFGCPAHGNADRIALEMLRQLLDPAQWAIELIEPRTLVAELIDVIAVSKPPLICIMAVPPGGLARARYLCKRLRASFPDLRLIVCRWGANAKPPRDPGGLKKAGADSVAGTLIETRRRIWSLLPFLAANQQNSGSRAQAGPSLARTGRAAARDSGGPASARAASEPTRSRIE